MLSVLVSAAHPLQTSTAWFLPTIILERLGKTNPPGFGWL
jgi:hypothetical protein